MRGAWRAWWVPLTASAAFAAPVRLRCERLENPLGIDSRTPRLSWQNDARERNWRQSAYQILVSSKPGGGSDVWDSGKQPAAESLDISYAGPAVESRRRYYWTVRVWDSQGRMSQSKEPAWWEMGLLAPSDWTARWIAGKDSSMEDRAGMHWISAGPLDPKAKPPAPAASFRWTFDLPAAPRDVALFVSSVLGFQIRVNNRPLVSRPGWRSFNRQDLTGVATPGQNTIEVAIPVAGQGLAALLKVVDSAGAIRRYPSGDGWEARIADGAWMPAIVGDSIGDAASDPAGNLPEPAALLRRAFAISKPVRSARLYVTALGSYQAWINGKRVGSDVLTPE